MKKVLLTTFIVLFLVSAAVAIPVEINYQGYLTDSNGVPVDGMTNMTFRLYDVESGGIQVWDSGPSPVAVDVANGVYSVILGDTSAGSTQPVIDPAIFASQLWLGIEVESDGEMTPRQRLTASSYAINAGTAEVAQSVAPDVITSAEIATWAVGTDEIADGAITLDKLDAGSVGNEQILDNAVTGAHIQDGSITSADIATPLVLSGTNDTGPIIEGVNSGLYYSVRGRNIAKNTWGSLAGDHGVYGKAFNTTGATYGGYFSSNSDVGKGVYGEATGLSGVGVHGTAPNSGAGTNYGGYFQASGTSGRGVLGFSSGSSGRGMYGWASGATGVGVYGTASDTGNVTNYGGRFEASGTTGMGIRAEASGANGIAMYGLASGSSNNIGGYIVAQGIDSKGIYTSGADYGVEAYATDQTGIAVKGFASNNLNVTNYGGYFESSGGTGYGIWGMSHGGSGTGVYGLSSMGGNFVNYGGYFKAHGDRGYGVYGWAASTANYVNYGGYFQADGVFGRGVQGSADGLAGIGLQGFSGGSSGSGVRGYATDSGSSTNYGGYFQADGLFGKGVYGTVSGAGASAVYGEHSVSGNIGYLGDNNYGVYGSSVSGLAGYFDGDVTVSGTLSANGSGLTSVNADTLDGMDSTAFSSSAHNHDGTYVSTVTNETISGQKTFANLLVSNSGISITSGGLSVTGVIFGNGSGLTNLSPAQISAGTASINITGSASNADTLDGLDSSDFGSAAAVAALQNSHSMIRTEYYSIGPPAFTPLNSSYNYIINSLAVNNVDGFSDNYVAPIHLPHGSTIKSITASWVDNSVTEDIAISVYRTNILTGGAAYYGSINSIGTTGLASKTASFNVPIDNTVYVYNIDLTIEGDSGVMNFRGLTIEYEEVLN